MVHPNSLANLRKPHSTKRGYGFRHSLPQEKVDALFMYLAEGKPLVEAAKASDMCFETAKRYFERGDTRRGIAPLRQRLTIFQERVSEKFNVLLEERRMKMLDTVKKAIDLFSQQIDEGNLMSKPTLNHLDKLMRLEVFLSGGVTQKETEKKFLTAEELAGGDPSEGGTN